MLDEDISLACPTLVVQNIGAGNVSLAFSLCFMGVQRSIVSTLRGLGTRYRLWS